MATTLRSTPRGSTPPLRRLDRGSARIQRRCSANSTPCRKRHSPRNQMGVQRLKPIRSFIRRPGPNLASWWDGLRRMEYGSSPTHRTIRRYWLIWKPATRWVERGVYVQKVNAIFLRRSELWIELAESPELCPVASDYRCCPAVRLIPCAPGCVE